MPYPETVKYIKEQIEKGISADRIKKALVNAGYQSDVIDQLLEKVGIQKQEKKAAGIEKLILKDISIGFVLLLIIGSLVYFNFFSGAKEMLGPKQTQNLKVDFSKISTIELGQDREYTLETSKYVKYSQYSADQLTWDYTGSVCLNIKQSGSQIIITSIFLPDCPYEETLKLEATTPDGETASGTIQVVIV